LRHRYEFLITLLDTARGYMQSAVITRSTENQERLIRRAQDLIATVTRLVANQELSGSDQKFAIQRELKRTIDELHQVRALRSVKDPQSAREVAWALQQAV
jgi:hypothetical protein